MILTTHYFRKTETKEIKKIKSSKRKQSLRIQDVIDTLIKMYLLESKREEKSL
jgi:predicted AlkP superfamily phosphohydrolase/phosphomutase